MSRRWLIVLLSLNCLAGCSGVSPAQIGQTVGTMAGSAIAPGPGGMVGALVGLATGMLVQSHVDKVVEQRERQSLGSAMGAGAAGGMDEPAGQPSRVWVDETLANGKVIAGHFDSRVIP